MVNGGCGDEHREIQTIATLIIALLAMLMYYHRNKRVSYHNHHNRNHHYNQVMLIIMVNDGRGGEHKKLQTSDDYDRGDCDNWHVFYSDNTSDTDNNG